MSKVQIGTSGLIGAGSWATALTQVATRRNRKLLWWVKSKDVADRLRETACNARYLPDVRLNLEGITFTTDLNELFYSVDCLLLCVPSAFLSQTLKPIDAPWPDHLSIVSFIKGLEPDTGQTIGEFLCSAYGVDPERFAVVSGPSHAEEVAQGAVTYLTAASTSPDLASALAEYLASPILHITPSESVRAVEYAGVLKNVYTVGAGMAVGLGYGDNFLAVYLGGCLREMRRFFVGRDLCPIERLSDSPFLGDLLATAYSPYSRNRKLGLLMGQGNSIAEALALMPMVAEGYYAARLMVEKQGYNQPIARLIYEALYRRVHPQDVFREIELILR
jgi:glycerol-3-phosphate dehydrogenase (NAD(P)+)